MATQLSTKDRIQPEVGRVHINRAEFGEVRLVFAAEGGHVIGKPGPDGVKLSDTVVGRMYPEKQEGKR